MMCTLKVTGWTQPGKWTITVSNRDKIPISISWEVWSRKPTNAENAITLSTHLTRTDVSFPQLIVITASLMKGTRPVVDAVVTAIVTRPGASPTHIHLQDNGAGADLMPFDGLYSATFTQFTVDGYYSVRVVANQNNQNKQNFTLNEDFNNMMAAKQARLGFRYVTDDLPPDYSNIIKAPEPKSGEKGDLLPAFQRIQVPGTFKVKNLPLSEVDVFPPSRIVDLVGQVTPNNEVQLSWTAPGDDLDNGQASAYSIRVSDNFDDLVDKFNQQHELVPASLLSSSSFKINKPKMSGLKELVTFSSPVKAKMVFVAVKTRDNNQWSEISNVVHVSFKALPNQVACTCPVKPKLKSAICTQEFVFVGTVARITNNIIRFRSGAEFLKSRFSFPARLFPQVKLDITNRDVNGCLCPEMPQVGQTYVMSGNIRGQLEVTNQSYMQKAPSDMAALRDMVTKTRAAC